MDTFRFGGIKTLLNEGFADMGADIAAERICQLG